MRIAHCFRPAPAKGHHELRRKPYLKLPEGTRLELYEAAIALDMGQPGTMAAYAWRCKEHCLERTAVLAAAIGPNSSTKLTTVFLN